MSTWRMAGINYVTYSNIAAKVLRMSLKSPFKEEAMKKGESHIKMSYWFDGEKLPTGEKPPAAKGSPTG